MTQSSSGGMLIFDGGARRADLTGGTSPGVTPPLGMLPSLPSLPDMRQQNISSPSTGDVASPADTFHPGEIRDGQVGAVITIALFWR
jgi:hypothetical protein